MIYYFYDDVYFDLPGKDISWSGPTSDTYYYPAVNATIPGSLTANGSTRQYGGYLGLGQYEPGYAVSSFPMVWAD